MKKYKTYSIYILVFHLLSFQKCFIFSVIIAIFNTGNYLDDSINSLLNQTIDSNKIQIILVNDGSTDQTEEICLKFQKTHKKNIFYIKIEHGGVSKSRNSGLNYAEGKYINFLDADDKWDYYAFNNFLLFFEAHKEIDLVAGRIKFFEAEENYHPLDYKFYKTRVVNLNEDYTSIQLSASSCIFRKSVIQGKYFDERVFYCEDSRFVNSILLIKPVMGLIKESIYYYRRRADFTSAIQNQKHDLNFYFGTLNSVSNYLINSSKALYDKILPFIQFLISYDLFFRIQSQACIFLDSKNFKKYSIMIDELLRQIDDKYILEQKILSNRYKLFVLSKKYNKDIRNDIELRNDLFIYLNYTMINLKSDKSLIIWKMLDIKNNVLYLEAIDNLWLSREKYTYFFRIGNQKFFPNYFENPNYDFYTMNGLTQKGRIIAFDIPLEMINLPQTFYFCISYMGIETEIFTSLGRFSHIPPIPHGYYISGNYIIKYIESRLVLFKYTENLENKFEKIYCHELQKAKKGYIIKLRKHLKYKKRNKNKRKPDIWIINDRRDRAGDNGEFFFRFLKMKKPEGIMFYFAIEGNCPDFKRLKILGDILDLNSKKYIKIFMESDKIITSVSYPWVDNPFNNDRIYVTDLFHFDIVFLQNGIIKDDLSKSLNRFNKNYSLFITSTKREYKSILNPYYGYNKTSVILTGMPKYDTLYQLINKISKEKIILIMPTWRINIQGTRDFVTYKSIYSNKFILSKFYEFYNRLINEEKLHLIMREYNYKGILCLHPFFDSQSIDFKENEFFTIMKKYDYPNILLKASLLITDYSSIFFDFGYLKKPIIYAHFDYEEYRNYHYHQGYFDYSKDGFGPICKDISCIVNETLFEFENNCVLKKKYMKRIDKFFTFFDDKNSERIFEEIIKHKLLIKTNETNNYFLFNVLLFFLILYKLKTFLI